MIKKVKYVLSDHIIHIPYIYTYYMIVVYIWPRIRLNHGLRDDVMTFQISFRCEGTFIPDKYEVKLTSNVTNVQTPRVKKNTCNSQKDRTEDSETKIVIEFTLSA